MKKDKDITADRMEFLPHFGSDSKNGWLRIDIAGLNLQDAEHLFINMDDIEQLTRVPLSEITDDIRSKWDKERKPDIDTDLIHEDIEYIDIGKVKSPKKKK